MLPRLMATTPDPVNRFSSPVSIEEFQTWFDGDGRLVKESLMRQCLFEGNHEARGYRPPKAVDKPLLHDRPAFGGR